MPLNASGVGNVTINNVTYAIGPKANLRGADLRGAYLEKANLEGANLIGARLDGATLNNANLNGTNMRGAYLINAQLTNASLIKADLEGAILVQARLVGADMQEAILQEAFLNDAISHRANYYRAIMVGARLINTNFTDANLSYANMSNSNLEGAILVNANIDNAILEDAIMHNTTISKSYNSVIISFKKVKMYDPITLDYSNAYDYLYKNDYPEKMPFIIKHNKQFIGNYKSDLKLYYECVEKVKSGDGNKVQPVKNKSNGMQFIKMYGISGAIVLCLKPKWYSDNSVPEPRVFTLKKAGKVDQILSEEIIKNPNDRENWNSSDHCNQTAPQDYYELVPKTLSAIKTPKSASASKVKSTRRLTKSA